MGRAPCCEKVGMKRGRWTTEEDDILVKYIRANGEGSWRSLPKNAGLLRCGKSCRLRWMNYLKADVKRGNISKEEEETIIKLHTTFGNRWSLIANQLPGRTDNEIKNYWNSHLGRKIHSFPRINDDNDHNTAEAVLNALGKLAQGGGKRRGSLPIATKGKKKKNETSNMEKQEMDGSSTNNSPQQANSLNSEGLVEYGPLRQAQLVESQGSSESGDMSPNSEMAAAILDEEVGDWDMEVMLSKLWEEAGDMWPTSMWGRGDLEFQSVEGSGGYQEGKLDSSTWLV